MTAAGVKGYTFGRPGYLYHLNWGPVVAAAMLPPHATMPLCYSRKACIRDRHRRTVSGQWLRLLESSVVGGRNSALHMFLRGHVHPGIPARQYAICGPEFA